MNRGNFALEGDDEMKRNCCGLRGRGFDDFSREDLRDIILHKNKVIADLEEHAYGSASWIENLNKGIKKANEIKRKVDKKPPKETDEEFKKRLEGFDKDKDAPTEAWGADELDGGGVPVSRPVQRDPPREPPREPPQVRADGSNVGDILASALTPEQKTIIKNALMRANQLALSQYGWQDRMYPTELDRFVRTFRQYIHPELLPVVDENMPLIRQIANMRPDLRENYIDSIVDDIGRSLNRAISSSGKKTDAVYKQIKGGAAPTPTKPEVSPVAAAAAVLKPVREKIQNGIGDALYGKEDDPKKQRKGLLGISEEGKEESKKKVMKNIVVPIVKAANQLKTNIEDTANMIFNKDKYDADMKERRIKSIKKAEAEAGIVRDKENPSIIIRKPRGMWSAETTDPTEEAYNQKRQAVFPRKSPFGEGETNTKDVFYIRVPNPIFAAKLKPSMKEFSDAGVKLWTGVQQANPNISEDVDGTLKQLQDDAFIFIPEDNAKEIYAKLRQFVADKQDEEIAPEFADEGWTKGELKRFAKIDPRTLKGQDLIDYKESKLAFDRAQTQNALDKVNKDIADEEAKTGYVVINNTPVKREPDQARLAKMREAKQRVLKRQQDLVLRGQQEFKDMMMFSNAEKAKRDAEYYARQKADAQGTIDQADADKAEFDAKPIAERIAILESYKAEMGDDPAIDEQIQQLREEEASNKVEEQAQGSVDLLQQAEVIGMEGGGISSSKKNKVAPEPTPQPVSASMMTFPSRTAVEGEVVGCNEADNAVILSALKLANQAGKDGIMMAGMGTPIIGLRMAYEDSFRRVLQGTILYEFFYYQQRGRDLLFYMSDVAVGNIGGRPPLDDIVRDGAREVCLWTINEIRRTGANKDEVFDDIKRYTGRFRGRGGATPKDPALYEKAKAIVNKSYPKHSAYRSGAYVKKYKEMGGEYEDEPDGKRPLARWFKEDWKDVGNKEYPVYRPTKRVSKETPLTPEEIDPENLKLQIEEKQKIRGERNLSAFKKRGGAKPVEMKQSDYYKEHKNIVKLLKNTGKSLLSEAKDQQEEATAMAKKLNAPDPFDDAEMVGAGAIEYTLTKVGKPLFNPSGDMSKAGRQSFTPDYDAYGDSVEDGKRNAFNLARSMYDQTKAIELPDFKLIKDDTSLRFYQKMDESVMLVGIRGTDVKSWTDLYTWAVIGANQDLRMTTRFQEDLAKLVAFQRNYPPSQFYYVATGSSLAGSIADRFLELGLIEEAITYNPSIEKKYVLEESILNHRVYLDTDPLFILMGQYAPNTEIRVNPNKTNFYNPSKEKDYLIASHSIYPIYNPAFEGGGMEGSGKTYTLEEWKAIFDAKLEEKRKAIEAREAKKKQTAKAKRERAKARREAREKATPPKEPEPAEEEEPEVEIEEYEMGGETYLVETPREGLAFAERRVFDNDGEEIGKLTEDDVGKTLVKMVMRREKLGAFAEKSPKSKSSSESLPFFESRQPVEEEEEEEEEEDVEVATYKYKGKEYDVEAPKGVEDMNLEFYKNREVWHNDISIGKLGDDTPLMKALMKIAIKEEFPTQKDYREVMGLEAKKPRASKAKAPASARVELREELVAEQPRTEQGKFAKEGEVAMVAVSKAPQGTYMKLLKSPKLTDAERQLMMNLQRSKMTPFQKAKILGRSGLARKLMELLGVDKSSYQMPRDVKRIADTIEKRVEGQKVREIVLPEDIEALFKKQEEGLISYVAEHLTSKKTKDLGRQLSGFLKYPETFARCGFGCLGLVAKCMSFDPFDTYYGGSGDTLRPLKKDKRPTPTLTLQAETTQQEEQYLSHTKYWTEKTKNDTTMNFGRESISRFVLPQLTNMCLGRLLGISGIREVDDTTRNAGMGYKRRNEWRITFADKSKEMVTKIKSEIVPKVEKMAEDLKEPMLRRAALMKERFEASLTDYQKAELKKYNAK